MRGFQHEGERRFLANADARRESQIGLTPERRADRIPREREEEEKARAGKKGEGVGEETLPFLSGKGISPLGKEGDERRNVCFQKRDN